jgi:hypothetical protein
MTGRNIGSSLKVSRQKYLRPHQSSLPLLLIACAAVLPTSAQTTIMKTLRSDNVGIEFQYPDGWTVKRCTESSWEDCLMVEKNGRAPL